MAGAMAGCDNPPAAPPAKVPNPNEGTPPKAHDAEKGAKAGGETPDNAVASTAGEGGKSDPHVCRGLNACKGQGGGDTAGKNACAGQGDCATAKHHGCGPENECKGLGGCGANPAANECKGKGGCHVPLMDEAWEKVRKRFEDKMKETGKEFGKAPEKKKAA